MKNEQRQQIREALALLNSMVACGEDHTDTSRAALEKAISALNAEQQSQVAPVAWYLPDDNGEPFRATCYQTEAQGWESAGHAPLPLYAAPHCLHEELESTKRMFHAACADLGQINEALGLDPDDGGAEPILDTIEELKQQLAAQTAPVVPSGWKLVDERELLKIKHALESCDAGDYSTGSVIHPSYDEKAVEDALNSVTVMLSAAPSAPSEQLPQGWRDKLAEMQDASYTYSQHPELAHAIFDSVINALDELEKEAAPSEDAGWQPIETAPDVKGDFFFCRLAWGPDEDKSTGQGFRWNDRWFAAAVFHAIGQERSLVIREVEVTPTHWMPLPPAPLAATAQQKEGE